MEANLRILQSFKKINQKIDGNDQKQKEINQKINDFLEEINKEIKDLDNENKDLKKELSEAVKKIKQEKPINGKDGKDGRDGKDGSDGNDGVGIYDIEINDKGELIITLTNRKKINCGVVKGKDGIGFNGVSVTNAQIIDGELIITLSTGREINAGKINGGSIELIGGDNVAIEDNYINVYTNTGYSISDKDVKYQNITSIGHNPKKIIFVDERSLTFIIDGSNKLMVSKNNIDFEIQEFARNIDDIIFIPYNEALVILSSADGVIMVSSDYGLTWNEHSNVEWVGCDYLFTYKDNSATFNIVRKSEREIRSYRFNDGDYTPRDNGYFRTDLHDFMARFNNSYFISCDSTGKFGYCNEKYYYDGFADLPEGNTVNVVVSHESTPIVGLKNSNKIFRLRYTGNTGTSKWTEYTLPEVCTVNDVIYYSRTKEFYILNDVCSYFKTKDFVTYTKVDTGVRGLQGCVTLMGIQAITNNDGKLMLAPARTRLEDKAQEWDKATQKERWVGEGLKVNSTTGVVSVRVMNPLTINPSTGAIRLQTLTMDYLPDELNKTKMIAEAPVHSTIISEYGDLENWFWEVGYPEEYTCVHKIIFDEATSFWDLANYETEYFVEKYEYGYIYYDESDNYFFEYVKLGNFANLLDKE